MPFINLSSGTKMWYNVPTDTSGNNVPDITRPIILFIHANCTDGRQSHHQIECPEMAQNFTMISIDLPFCGLTMTPYDYQPGSKAAIPKPRGQTPKISFEKQAESIAEFIDKLKLPKVHLVSLGPNTAIAYILLLRYPALFKSSTFMSPSSLQETPEGREGFVQIWESMVNGCPEELEAATAAYYSLFFGHWSMRDLVRRERWFRMWGSYFTTLESRRYIFGEWMTTILAREPISVEEMRKGITVPVLVCSGSEHLIHPTAHDELDAVFATPGVETACPYYETHRLGNAPTMIAKTNYEEINMILGHFVCLVEGVELKAPRLGASNQGWYTGWQEPYLALEKRLDSHNIQNNRYMNGNASSASIDTIKNLNNGSSSSSSRPPLSELPTNSSLQQPQTQQTKKKSAWKWGNFVQALNSTASAK